tara:strand:- start:1599 stop:1946 length:348 start_codon:yes stop_codon:yes gene_type:complete
MSNSTSTPNDNVSLLDLTEANDSETIEKELNSSEKEKLPKKIEINKENITIQTLLNETTELLYEDKINRQSELAFFYFFLSFFFFLTSYVILWYVSTKYEEVSYYFNSFFCNKAY